MASKIKAKSITQDRLLRLLENSIEKNSSIKYGFVLGAGASVKSRIPSGSSLAKKWFKEIKEDEEEKEFKRWIKDEEITKDNLAQSYTKIFKKRFEVDYRAGYEELQRYMDNAEPSIGYSFLAQFLSKTSHKFVITTNFDTMVEDALFGLKEAKPLVLGHELLSKYINPTSPTRPTIIKIHRDFLLNPYNTDDDTKKLDEQWQKALKPLLEEHSIIVIGYGGNDDSLMNYLNTTEKRKPIFWCYRGDKDNLSSKIIELLTEKDFIVEISSFDKFMLLLNNKLDLGIIFDKENINNSPIVKNALIYANKYEEQLKDLATEPLDEEEQKAIKKLLPSWWHYQLEVNKETNDNKKEEIYIEGLKAYPKSYGLMNNYALLLEKLNRDTEAETYFKKALEIEANDATINGNYANLLMKLNRDDEAETYFKKALEIEANDATINGNYANLLKKLNRDDKAETYYKKALDIEANDATINSNYASLLMKLNRDDEAETYYKKALDIEANNTPINGNYALLLMKLNRDDKAETYYKKVLDIEPNNATTNGNYAQFLLIQGKKEEAEIYIENSFRNYTEQNDVLVELWFYRLAHYPKYYDEAIKELDLLLSKGIKSIAWDFSRNIEQARKENHKNIELLQEYAQKITNP